MANRLIRLKVRLLGEFSFFGLIAMTVQKYITAMSKNSRDGTKAYKE